MNTQSLALVESATQLLNAAEWAHAGGESNDVRIVVLAPTDPQSVRQITGVAQTVRNSGIPVVIASVRRPGPAMALHAGRVLSDVRRADRLVIGDPFSRYIHTVLPASRAKHVVIVDDGTATWDYATCVNAGAPLTRWSRSSAKPRAHAARATRMLSPGSRRSIDVFSCLGDSAPIGTTALANRYAWTRSTGRPVVLPNQIDLIGSSLADTGVIERRPYLGAIADVARAARRVRYIAHRRESENLLAEIATIPNVHIVRPAMPVEMFLRAGPVAAQVTAFPSTAAHTLPVVLSDVDVQLDVLPVEPSWFAAQTTDRARAFVARITDAAPVARRRPQLT